MADRRLTASDVGMAYRGAGYILSPLRRTAPSAEGAKGDVFLRLGCKKRQLTLLFSRFAAFSARCLGPRSPYSFFIMIFGRERERCAFRGAACHDAVRWRGDFVPAAKCKNRRFTGCKSRFLHKADGAKAPASVAAAWCAVPLTQKQPPSHHLPFIPSDLARCLRTSREAC